VKFQEYTVSAPGFPPLKILRPIPLGEEPWGVLAPLRGTPWGDLLSVINGEVLSHALHGHVAPLMQSIGRPPQASLKLVPDRYRTCSQHKDCLLASSHCHPCKKLPACYLPPHLEGEEIAAAATVALAWAEDRYVIVVEGAEFSL